MKKAEDHLLRCTIVIDAFQNIGRGLSFIDSKRDSLTKWCLYAFSYCQKDSASLDSHLLYTFLIINLMMEGKIKQNPISLCS